jgi:hypothetical protein
MIIPLARISRLTQVIYIEERAASSRFKVSLDPTGRCSVRRGRGTYWSSPIAAVEAGMAALLVLPFCWPAATAGLLLTYWPLRAVGRVAYWPLRAVGGLPAGPRRTAGGLPTGPRTSWQVAYWPEDQLAGCWPAATAGLLLAYWPLRAVGWVPAGPGGLLAGCLLARRTAGGLPACSYCRPAGTPYPSAGLKAAGTD